MFSAAIRRSATAVVTKPKRRLNTTLNDALIDWAEAPIYSEQAQPNPIRKDLFATATIIGTAIYVGYANSREHKDTTLFDYEGEIKLPILTPICDWIVDRFGETTRQSAVGIDPFEKFTEEEKMDRLRQLDAVGYFDRFWQDQNDDVDKARILTNTTTHALFRRVNIAAAHPERAFTIKQIVNHAALQAHTKQPELNVPVGDKIIRIETPLDRHAATFVAIAQQTIMAENPDSSKFLADKDAYAKAMGL